MNEASRAFLSVVAPVYNESGTLTAFHRRLLAALDELPLAYEILYVNDGSTDGSRALIDGYRHDSECVALIDLSRNFGKEIAVTAGLDHARGDAVIVIDSDLQDPPELIRAFIDEWYKGVDVVYAKRGRRAGESWLKRVTAGAFYRLMQHVGPVAIPRDTGDYRLLSRRAVDAVRQLREQHRFMKGLFTWIGYPQSAVTYDREGRFAGETKWNYWKLWNFAIEGITSFTLAPLKIATYAGFITAVGAFVYGLIIIFKTLIFGEDVQGYPSLMVVILFLGGTQLMALGIIGEYLGRTFNEVKQRPLYFVQHYLPARQDDDDRPPARPPAAN